MLKIFFGTFWGRFEPTLKNLSCWIRPAAQSIFGEQQWDSLVSEQSVGFQIKIGRPKFYAGEMITPAWELGTILIGAWPSFLVWSPP